MAPYHILKKVSLRGGGEGMDKGIQLNAYDKSSIRPVLPPNRFSWAGQISKLALDIDKYMYLPPYL